MTVSTGVPVAISADAPMAAAAQEDDETSAADLVLPLVVVAAVGALAGYGYVRRTRRARTRTTPGGTRTGPPAPSLTELDDRSRTVLAEADNWVRTSREELSFAEARSGPVAPFTRAVRTAESEISAAFLVRQRYDAGVPVEETSRRHALAGIVGRCLEAGHRLDAEAADFDRLRALEREIGEALAVAETRFRELTGRTATTETALASLAELYAPSATASVTGHVEQAKDRLVFATTHLNRSRQAADSGGTEAAARHLRAAEGAVDQAAAFVNGIDRLAGELRSAAGMVASALTGAEAELSGVRDVLSAAGEREDQAAGTGPGAGASATTAAGAGTTTREGSTAHDAGRSARRPKSPDALLGVPVGELRSRVLHADTVLTSVRQEVTGGQPYDPLDVLRRIVRALAPVATGRAGVLPAAARLVARSAIAVADTFVATHRGAVGAEARTRLAAARDLLDAAPLADLVRAHTLARQARELAEQDVRVHGNPLAGAAAHGGGVAGAVLGGILLGGGPDGGPPPSFGGPHTRARRNLPRL